MILALMACGWAQSAGSGSGALPITSLTIEASTVEAEVADTRAEREHGLMQRASLLPDHGMLFVYPDERPRTFWMKDTPLPLSIAYLDQQGRIVRIADMQPFDTSPVPSVRPAMYALEMAQGWFTVHSVGVGMAVKGLPPASSE